MGGVGGVYFPMYIIVGTNVINKIKRLGGGGVVNNQSISFWTRKFSGNEKKEFWVLYFSEKSRLELKLLNNFFLDFIK